MIPGVICLSLKKLGDYVVKVANDVVHRLLMTAVSQGSSIQHFTLLSLKIIWVVSLTNVHTWSYIYMFTLTKATCLVVYTSYIWQVLLLHHKSLIFLQKTDSSIKNRHWTNRMINLYSMWMNDFSYLLCLFTFQCPFCDYIKAILIATFTATL